MAGSPRGAIARCRRPAPGHFGRPSKQWRACQAQLLASGACCTHLVEHRAQQAAVGDGRVGRARHAHTGGLG